MHTGTRSHQHSDKQHFNEDGHRPALDASGTSPPSPGSADHAPAHARVGGPLLRRSNASVVEPVKRLALTPSEAAAALGVGRTFFYEHVLPELRVIRRGRKRLILITDLVRWAERNAACLPFGGI